MPSYFRNKYYKMETSIRDIENRDDIKIFVDKFYEKVRTNSLLAPAFSHVDWVNHLPKMYNFWSSLILGDKSYAGTPLQHHLNLPVGRDHFDRWLILFHETINENFRGDKAKEVKERASAIAGVFQFKMSLIDH
jgi:hemoglobin